jgi:hydroxyacylglutathione hydrolase
MPPAWEAHHQVNEIPCTVTCFIVSAMENNVYVLADDQQRRAALIDPGLEGGREILAFLRQRGLTLDVILNTHAHLDHSFNNALFVRETGAALAIHEDDAPLLDNLGVQGAMFGLPAPENVRADRLLRDGDIVQVGGIGLRVVHTPGHSPGQSCFVMEGAAFVGDLVFAGSIGRTDLPGGSHIAMMRSLQDRLLSLPDETALYTGHGPATTVGRERRTNPFLLDLA